MEQRTATIPFDLETAKKINIGEIAGRIVTEKGQNRAEIVYEDNSSNSFRNGPKSGIKVADLEDNYEWTNKDGNEKYSTKNLPKAHFRWDWRRYTLSKESVDKITEFVDTILES